MATQVPASLNGYPVIASRQWRGGAETLVVCVFRADEPALPFVVALWGADLLDAWAAGDYLPGLGEAAAAFAARGGRL